MGRKKRYTDAEREIKRKEAVKRYYESHKGDYVRRSVKYWAGRLRKEGYTVIPPGGDEA